MSQDHTETVASVKSALLAQGQDLSGPCGAFQICHRVAWIHKAEGWGLIHSTGNGCETHGDKFRADTIMLHDGTVIDLLAKSESDNGDTSIPANYNIPQWQPTGGQDPGNWRAPFDPGDSPIPPGPGPAPGPDPGLEARVAALEVAVDSLAHMNDQQNEVIGALTKKLHDQPKIPIGWKGSVSVFGYRVPVNGELLY